MAILHALCLTMCLIAGYSEAFILCRGQNNLPVPSPMCLAAKCPTEAFNYAVCSEGDNSSGSAELRISTWLQILVSQDQQNVTVTASQRHKYIEKQISSIRYWLRSYDNCSNYNQLTVQIVDQILPYSLVTVRLNTVKYVEQYGLFFIESPEQRLTLNDIPRQWVVTLGYMIQASKAADGRILPGNADRFYVLVSTPKPNAGFLKDSNVRAHLQVYAKTTSGINEVGRATKAIEYCKAVWCTVDFKDWLSALKGKVEVLSLRFDLPQKPEEKIHHKNVQKIFYRINLPHFWSPLRPSVSAPGNQKPNSTLVSSSSNECNHEHDQPLLTKRRLTMILICSVLSVTAVAVTICSVFVFVIRRNRRCSQLRILLIVTASPDCLGQLSKQRLGLLTREYRWWRKLRRRAERFGYQLQLATIDSSNSTIANSIHLRMVDCSSRVLILGDRDNAHKLKMLPPAIERIALMEKHRCFVLQWPQQQQQQKQQQAKILYETIRNFLDEGKLLGEDYGQCDA